MKFVAASALILITGPTGFGNGRCVLLCMGMGSVTNRVVGAGSY